MLLYIQRQVMSFYVMQLPDRSLKLQLHLSDAFMVNSQVNAKESTKHLQSIAFVSHVFHY